MKYIAVFDDDFLSKFRLDDNGLTLVIGDKQGYSRAVRLKPLIQKALISECGGCVYLTQNYIDCLLKYERDQMIKMMMDDQNTGKRQRMTNKEAIEVLNNWDMACPICEKRKSEEKGVCVDCRFNKALDLAIKSLEERPQGEYVDISKLRLMTVEECAGHTLEYAMGWKACVEWIKKGGAEE